MGFFKHSLNAMNIFIHGLGQDFQVNIWTYPSAVIMPIFFSSEIQYMMPEKKLGHCEVYQSEVSQRYMVLFLFYCNGSS